MDLQTALDALADYPVLCAYNANVDAIRVITDTADREESMRLTEEALGLDGQLGQSVSRPGARPPAVTDGGPSADGMSDS